MNGVNKVFVIGNLGRDPEIRYTQSNTAVCNISLAVNSRVKDGDGWREHTEWVPVVIWGRSAESTAQYMSKGKAIHVEGRLQTRDFTDKEGVKRRSTEVVAESVTFLGGDQRPLKKADRPPREQDAWHDDELPF